MHYTPHAFIRETDDRQKAKTEPLAMTELESEAETPRRLKSDCHSDNRPLRRDAWNSVFVWRTFPNSAA
jgi:hypothetical protein